MKGWWRKRKAFFCNTNMSLKCPFILKDSAFPPKIHLSFSTFSNKNIQYPSSPSITLPLYSLIISLAEFMQANFQGQKTILLVQRYYWSNSLWPKETQTRRLKSLKKLSKVASSQANRQGFHKYVNKSFTQSFSATKKIMNMIIKRSGPEHIYMGLNSMLFSIGEQRSLPDFVQIKDKTDGPILVPELYRRFYHQKLQLFLETHH